MAGAWCCADCGYLWNQVWSAFQQADTWLSWAYIKTENRKPNPTLSQHACQPPNRSCRGYSAWAGPSGSRLTLWWKLSLPMTKREAVHDKSSLVVVQHLLNEVDSENSRCWRRCTQHRKCVLGSYSCWMLLCLCCSRSSGGDCLRVWWGGQVVPGRMWSWIFEWKPIIGTWNATPQQINLTEAGDGDGSLAGTVLTSHGSLLCSQWMPCLSDDLKHRLPHRASWMQTCSCTGHILNGE